MRDSELIDAIKAGDEARAMALLERDPELGMGSDEPGALLTALYMRQAEVATAIARRKPSLSLFEAAALGDLAAVRRAVEGGAAVSHYSGDGFTALHLASYFGHPDMVEWLLSRGADANAVADNPMKVAPLHSAAAAGSVPVCERLLQSGAHPNPQQHGGYTPLQSAALHGNRELVELLLKAGADPRLKSDDGRDAAAFASAGGHDDLAQRLQPGEGG
jgi:ankyrin repeat protein